MKQSLRIVFMGTPEFAVPMLDSLCHSAHSVVGVVTAPDRPAGRGMQLSESGIKKYAKSKGLLILQPEKLKNENFLAQLKALNADIFVVVAFRMLPEIVWAMPPLGTINLHASLLPQYRGAAPIHWAIINGEKQTGVTTFKLQHEIDTGQIILQSKVPIRDDETVGELYHELMDIGKHTLLNTVDAIAQGDYPLAAQDHIQDVKHAPKLFKENCQIDWTTDATTIYNKVRGLSPSPTAWTTLQGKILKIYRCEKCIKPHLQAAGAIDTDGKTYLRYYCADGFIELIEVQLEGKRKIEVSEFLKGYKVQ